VIEPSVGVDRLMLAILSEAYTTEVINETDSREVLKLHHRLAPYKLAILPLQKQQVTFSDELFAKLSSHFMCSYDASGTIGKRYRRQDAIGTPFCLTVDFDSATNGTVTLRNRDTMAQETIKIDDLLTVLQQKLS